MGILRENFRNQTQIRRREIDLGDSRRPKLIAKTNILLLVLMSLGAAKTLQISTSTDFQKALDTISAGDSLVLAAGTYTKVGGFKTTVGISGTAEQPIVLMGPRTAILSSGNLNSGTALKLSGQNSHFHIRGLSFQNSQKGIEIYESQFVHIDSVFVTNMGQEGVHFLRFSSDNILSNSWIDSVGMVAPQYGEGVYLGSAESNWISKSDGKPDSSDRNQILNNRFGDLVRAENIDIKEGTHGGLVQGNQFNGKGLANQNSADSWIDIKGNGYKILNNTGSDTYLDGFQSHINYANYGDSNVIAGNTLTVNASGYGINIQTSGSRGTANANVVCDNNIVTGAGLGLSNVSAQSCAQFSPVLQSGRLGKYGIVLLSQIPKDLDQQPFLARSIKGEWIAQGQGIAEIEKLRIQGVYWLEFAKERFLIVGR